MCRLAAPGALFCAPMSTEDIKSRMITVRVSEEDFLRIQAICTNSGIHNVSEFARNAMQHELEQLDGRIAAPTTTELRFREVFNRLSTLEQRFHAISEARKERT